MKQGKKAEPTASHRTVNEPKGISARSSDRSSDEPLLKSLKKYADLYYYAPLGDITLDRSGIIIEANHTAAEQFAYPEESLPGTPFVRLVHRNDKALFELHMRHLCEYGEKEAAEILIVRKNRTFFNARLESVPVNDSKGKLSCVRTAVIDVTDRRKAETSILESEEKFRTLFEKANDIIVYVGRNGKIVDINDMVEEVLGYKKQDLIGKNFMKTGLLGLKDLPMLAREFKSAINQKAVRDTTGRNSNVISLEIKRKDGNTAFIEASTAVVKKNNVLHGFLTIVRDVSERKKSESQIRQSELKYKALVETTQTGFVITDEHNVVLDANNLYTYMSGHSSQDQIIGKAQHLWIAEPDRERFAGKRKECRRKGYIRALEINFIDSRGCIKPVEMNTTLMLTEGGERYISLVRDISERKKMEERLRAAAITDELTGLYNRRGFLTLVEQQCKLSDRVKKQMPLIYIDLDNMKQINDQLGHSAGDQALKDVSDVLRKTLRDSDICARIGGDEFAVVLSVPSEQGAENRVVKNLVTTLDDLNSQENRLYRLGFSTGITYYDPARPCSVGDLLSRADSQMYKEKRTKIEKHVINLLAAGNVERRLYKRTKINGACSADFETNGTFIKNMSSGGMCLETSRELPVRKLHYITVTCGDRQVTVKCIIVRTRLAGSAARSDEPPEYYEAGMKFIGQGRDEKRQIDFMLSRIAS